VARSASRRTSNNTSVFARSRKRSINGDVGKPPVGVQWEVAVAWDFGSEAENGQELQCEYLPIPQQESMS
jgi:hypothetical protein